MKIHGLLFRFIVAIAFLCLWGGVARSQTFQMVDEKPRMFQPFRSWTSGSHTRIAKATAKDSGKMWATALNEGFEASATCAGLKSKSGVSGLRQLNVLVRGSVSKVEGNAFQYICVTVESVGKPGTDQSLKVDEVFMPISEPGPFEIATQDLRRSPDHVTHVIVRLCIQGAPPKDEADPIVCSIGISSSRHSQPSQANVWGAVVAKVEDISLEVK